MASIEDRRVHSPVTPYVLAGRILAIIGMGFTAAVTILFVVGAFWAWAAVAAAAFLPFLGLIVLVERYQSRHGLIGPETASPSE